MVRMWNWEECWCGRVAETQRTVFVCAVNIRWIAKRYQFCVGTSKKNMFGMLGIRLTRRTPNKPLFGFHSGSPQSRMPRSHLCTDVDISWGKHRTLGASYSFLCSRKTHKFWFVGNGMQTVRRWRSAGLQSNSHIRAFSSHVCTGLYTLGWCGVAASTINRISVSSWSVYLSHNLSWVRQLGEFHVDVYYH